MNGAVLADDSYSGEDKLIDDEGNQIVDKEDRKYFKRYHFPILYALNEFYDLREKGTDVVFKGTTFKEIMDKIDNNKYSPVNEDVYGKEVGEIIVNNVNKNKYSAEYLPISDGGEGFLDVIEYVLKLKKQSIKVYDPMFRETIAHYIIDDENKTAY